MQVMVDEECVDVKCSWCEMFQCTLIKCVRGSVQVTVLHEICVNY